MAITVSFGKSNKKVNSTLQPSMGSSVACTLKKGTSNENPVFELQGSIDWSWNVCYCATFGKYYFITDITYRESVYEISCSCDYLASYKTEILASNAYVERTNFDNRNAYIADTMIPTAVNATILTANTPLSVDSAGSIIICTAGKSGNGFTWLTPSNFNALCSFLYTKEYTDGIQDFLENPTDVAKEVARPQDYLISATWIPFAVRGGTPVSVTLGYVNTGISGFQISNGALLSVSATVTIPRTTESATYPYQNFAPYAKYDLAIPFYGNIPLNPCQLGENILLNYTVDVTGACDIAIFSGGILLANLNGNCGVNVGWSARQTNIIGTTQVQVNALASNVSSIISGMQAPTLGNIAKSAINAGTALANGVLSSLQTAVPTVSNSGGSGSIYVNNVIYLTCSYMPITAMPFGYPCCKSLTLSACSGFTKTANASLQVSASDSGKHYINSYFDRGVFIE